MICGNKMNSIVNFTKFPAYVIIIVTLFSSQINAQKQYFDQFGEALTKKEFRKLKRKGSDSLLEITSMDNQVNELRLRRKIVEVSNSNEEINTINQITGNSFDTEQPLLILYYPTIEEATLVRDELLISKHWYTREYAIILREINKSLGNILIVAGPNPFNIKLPGIYNDDLNYFKYTYFNSKISTASFFYLSEENSFIEPIDFMITYASLNQRKWISIKDYEPVKNDSVTEEIVTVNNLLQPTKVPKTNQLVKKIEYFTLNQSKVFKVIHEMDEVKTIDTVLRNNLADYLFDISGQVVERNDTIVIDFNKYYTYQDYSLIYEIKRRLKRTVEREDNQKYFHVVEPGSLYIPEEGYYDFEDNIRKTFLPEYSNHLGSLIVIFPDGKMTLSNSEEFEFDIYDLLDYEKFKRTRERWYKSNTSMGIVTPSVQEPRKQFNPALLNQ